MFSNYLLADLVSSPFETLNIEIIILSIIFVIIAVIAAVVLIKKLINSKNTHNFVNKVSVSDTLQSNDK